MNLREINELGLNQVFKKKIYINQQTKVSVHVIKDNSISLLEFIFDLNFDKIIFAESPIKIVQNKDQDFLEFNSFMDSLKSYHHIIINIVVEYMKEPFISKLYFKKEKKKKKRELT